LQDDEEVQTKSPMLHSKLRELFLMMESSEGFQKKINHYKQFYLFFFVMWIDERNFT
jgi:hypothetical protein